MQHSKTALESIDEARGWLEPNHPNQIPFIFLTCKLSLANNHNP